MWQLDKIAFGMTMLVALLCIVIDPTTGIVVGAVFGMLRFADSISGGQSELIVKKGDTLLMQISGDKLDEIERTMIPGHSSIFSEERIAKIFEEPVDKPLNLASMVDLVPGISDGNKPSMLIYRLIGNLTYVNMVQHAARVKKLSMQGGNFVILSFQFLFLVDVDGIDILEDIERELKHHNKQLLISDVTSSIYGMVMKSEWFKNKLREKHVFATFEQALAWCNEQYESNPLHIDSEAK